MTVPASNRWLGTTRRHRRAAYQTVAGAAATAGLAVLLSLVAGLYPRLGLTLLAVIAVLALWTFAWRWSSPLLSGGLLILSAGLLAPKLLEALGELLLLGFVIHHALRDWRERGNRWRIGAYCLAACGIWLILGLNPNVPSLSVAFTGVRKTLFVLVGLAAGCLWPARTRKHAAKFIISLLIIGALISLLIHLGDPTLEDSFSRQAGVYTGLFEGRPRLQGIYAGPFHVALLGSFLTLRSWQMFLSESTRRWLSILGFAALGVALIALANVRTAYVAVALGLVVTPLLSSSSAPLGTRTVALLRTGSLAIVLVLVLASGLVSDNALSSLPTAASSGRDVGRLAGWSEAISLFATSPFVGQGPGSTVSTLGPDFAGHNYVSSDNQFVGILAGGGIIGLMALSPLAVAVWRRRHSVLSLKNPSAAAALVLFGFCLTGNAFEAAPVSVFLAAIVGLALVPGRNVDT